MPAGRFGVGFRGDCDGKMSVSAILCHTSKTITKIQFGCTGEHSSERFNSVYAYLKANVNTVFCVPFETAHTYSIPDLKMIGGAN